MATKKTTKAAPAKAAVKTAPVKKAVASKSVPAPKAAKPAKVAKPVKAEKPVKATKSSRVTFHVRAEIGSKVFLAGCFNDWDPTVKQMADKDGSGDFVCGVNLPKGTYEYKFVINGTWCADPECTDWVQNDQGTLNSVKVVD